MSRHPRSWQGERTRTAIASAAERLFAAHGFGPTTIDDVASTADVSVGSVYVHFGNKDDLHAVLVRRAVEERSRRVGERFWSDSPLERLVNAGDAYADFALRRPYGFWLSARKVELSAVAPAPDDHVEAMEIPDATEILRQDALAAMAAGEIREAPVEQVVDYLWGAWTGIIAMHLVDEPGHELRRTLHFAFRMVTDGLRPLPGLASET